MKFTIKIYLTALILMAPAFSAYGADLTPEELAQIEQDYAALAIQKSQQSETERKQKSSTADQEALDLARAMSLSSQSTTVVPAKSSLSEEEQLAYALSLSSLEAEEKTELEKYAQEKAALDAFAAKLKQEKEQKEAMAEKERKEKATQPIIGFKTVFHKVHPQEGASCGLHAIDNGNKCFTALREGKSTDELERLLMTGLSEGAQTVKRRDMLDPLEIHSVALNNLAMDVKIFTIIPNITQSKEEFLKPLPEKTDIVELPYYLGPAIEALRTQARATHIFVIGDMTISRNERGELVGQNDHWISIVADKKDSIVTLHYMDTIGGRDEKIIQILQAIIEHSNYYGIQLAAQLEEHSLLTIKRLLKDGDYNVLPVLEHQIDLAQKAGVINDARFPKQEIREILESIKEEPYQTQAQALLKRL